MVEASAEVTAEATEVGTEVEALGTAATVATEATAAIITMVSDSETES